MDHDDFSDIKMIHAASEKDFVKEYDEILENLADTSKVSCYCNLIA